VTGVNWSDRGGRNAGSKNDGSAGVGSSSRGGDWANNSTWAVSDGQGGGLSDGVSVGTLSQGGRSWAVCCQGSGGDGLIDGCVRVSTQDGTMNTGCEGSKANNFETHVIVGGRM